MSEPDDRSDEIAYHPVDVGARAGEGGGSSSSDSFAPSTAEEDRQRQFRTGWWCHRGPVRSCCFCFSLRTAVFLLSFLKMFSGVTYAQVENWTIPLVQKALDNSRAAYKRACVGLIVSHKHDCEVRWNHITDTKKSLAYLEGVVPLYHAIGALYVFFALVGWRAAYSRNSTLAKVFLLSFPSAFAVNVVCAFLSPNEFSPVGMFLDGLILAYFFKVAWSFYIRIWIIEATMRSLVEGMTPPSQAAQRAVSSAIV